MATPNPIDFLLPFYRFVAPSRLREKQYDGIDPIVLWSITVCYFFDELVQSV